jgi:hypothetical protein
LKAEFFRRDRRDFLPFLTGDFILISEGACIGKKERACFGRKKEPPPFSEAGANCSPFE